VGRNLIAAEAVTRKLSDLTLHDALLLVQLFAEKEPVRFERAGNQVARGTCDPRCRCRCSRVVFEDRFRHVENGLGG
jgi:hypothetical protein